MLCNQNINEIVCEHRVQVFVNIITNGHGKWLYFCGTFLVFMTTQSSLQYSFDIHPFKHIHTVHLCAALVYHTSIIQGQFEVQQLAQGTRNGGDGDLLVSGGPARSPETQPPPFSILVDKYTAQKN